MNAPKKLTVKGSEINSGIINLGTKLMSTVPNAIIIFEVINPTPYKIRIKKLLLGLFAIPKDQKKKIALSSQGMSVCKIPKKNAGINIIKNSCIFVRFHLKIIKPMVILGMTLFNFDHN